MIKSKTNFLPLWALLFVGVFIFSSCAKEEFVDPLYNSENQLSDEEIFSQGEDMTEIYNRILSENPKASAEEMDILMMAYLNDDGGITNRSSCSNWVTIGSTCNPWIACNNGKRKYRKRRWCGPPCCGAYQYAWWCSTVWC